VPKTKSPGFGRGLFLISILSITVWVELIRQLYLVLIEGVRWFWGLTCDFWAENAKKKCNGKCNRKSKGKNNGNKSVASPFGLRSGLRQSGGRFAAGFRRGAEAPLYLDATSNSV
jgi:hypothetical protein